jgi:hypothetical protein
LNDGLLDLVTALVVPGTSALFLLSAAPPTNRLGDGLRRADDATTAVLDVDSAAILRHAFGTDNDGSQIRLPSFSVLGGFLDRDPSGWRGSTPPGG